MESIYLKKLSRLKHHGFCMTITELRLYILLQIRSIFDQGEYLYIKMIKTLLSLDLYIVFLIQVSDQHLIDLQEIVSVPVIQRLQID